MTNVQKLHDVSFRVCLLCTFFLRIKRGVSIEKCFLCNPHEQNFFKDLKFQRNCCCGRGSRSLVCSFAVVRNCLSVMFMASFVAITLLDLANVFLHFFFQYSKLDKEEVKLRREREEISKKHKER